MPNTPVAIEQGVSAIIGNSFSSLSQVNWTEKLFNNLGKIAIGIFGAYFMKFDQISKLTKN